MGAEQSMVATALQAMEDDALVAMVMDAYRADAARVGAIIATAQRRLQEQSTKPSSSVMNSAADPTDDDDDADPSDDDDDEELPAPSTTTAAAAAAAVVTSSASSSSSSGPGALALPAATERPDQLAALWTFEGHTLRQLQRGDAAKRRRLDDSHGSANGSTAAAAAVAAVDEDGFPLLYGSCGREKRYARCSVCYFRGARCNTAHYCACCQRPVCVRPRTYPGDSQPKICWNVLHMDADMVQRVEKRRLRRTTSSNASSSPPPASAPATACATASAASSSAGLVVRLPPPPKRSRKQDATSALSLPAVDTAMEPKESNA
ncbi:hypothetical protein P43SY_004363 [Pythium insidiosum]|uniref:Uncharacterized protein n=1 Tax=Pythium insidiosum TaxID=114742 RepID=A0AAD5LHJ5_PYTIN|nr:hypothetical protein P43SY_004363 [Pythium insidiosum]